MARKKPCKLLFYIERGGIRERKGVRAWHETLEPGRKILHLPPGTQVQCGDVLFHRCRSGALPYEGWFPVIGVEVDKKRSPRGMSLGAKHSIDFTIRALSSTLQLGR